MPTETLDVLVVDDDTQLRRTLADVLRLHGYDALTAQDGHEALEMAREKQPALALVDLRLPDMDGMELVHRLRDLSSLTQVVILTGNASLASAVAALREQSCDYLIKPVSPAELLRTVASAGERWQRRNAEERLALAHEAVRTSEQRYRTIVETTREGVCIVAADGRVTYANARLARLLGREVDEVEGRALVTFLAPEEQDVFTGLLRRGERGIPDEHEFRLLRADGGSIWAWISLSPLQEPSGLVVASLAMVSDITERRELEERVRRVQKLDAIGRLAGGVAHDFNNILTVIMTESDMVLKGQAAPDAAHQSIAEIRRAAQRATELVKQLLAFSRSGMVRPAVFSLNGLVTGMESMLRRLIGERIALTCDCAPDAWNVEADAGQLEQVLTNLVVNARDAMPGGGDIVVHTANTRLDARDVRGMPGVAAGDYAVLSVTDTGTGMSDEVKAHLFEPFFTTKAPDKGTGLGMATSYGIVKQCGGHIAVYSELGRGSTIRVYLPAARGAADDAPGAAAPAPRGGHEAVLLVEDNAEVRGSSARVLRAAGYQVLEAADAEAALDIVAAGRVPLKLLLTDIVLPALSGDMLAERAVRLAPGLRVILTSGYPEQHALGGRRAPRGTLFLQKPLTADALLDAVRTQLDREPA